VREIHLGGTTRVDPHRQVEENTGEETSMAEYRIVGAGDMAPGDVKRVIVDGAPVCVARTDNGRLFAIGDTCSHEATSLSEGWLMGTQIECPMHSSVFDLETGEPTSLPATEPVPTFRVAVDGDDLLIEPA
jgi:3-phenylpropionate/trans-cinnamate dioxygenase ferredoxin subunit